MSMVTGGADGIVELGLGRVWACSDWANLSPVGMADTRGNGAATTALRSLGWVSVLGVGSGHLVRVIIAFWVTGEVEQ